MTIFDPVRRTLRRGIVLNEESLVYGGPVPPTLREELLRYSPKVVVHRGGNGPSRFRRSLEAGARVIEADVRWRDGTLVAGHERWLGPVAYDTNRRLLRLDREMTPLTILLDEAARQECTLMLDLKLGPASHVQPLLDALRTRGLEQRAWFTGDWSALDAIGEDAPAAPRYYGVNKASRLRRFVSEQPAAKRPGISLNRRLASPGNVDALRALGVDVIAYTVTGPGEALGLLKIGVDGLITNNLTLVELFSKRSV